MKAIAKGIALLILMAILIFLFWCYILGKCKGKISFGVIPPRPITTGGRKKSDDDDDDKLNVSGSGSGNAGASGSGIGNIIGNLVSRFQGIDTSKGVAQGGQRQQQQKKVQNEDCGFLGWACWWKNITAGKTIFGAPISPIMPRIGIGSPIIVPVP